MTARTPHRLFALICAVIAAALAVFASRSAAQERITAENITDEHVRKAIDVIVEELYALKHPRNFWDPVPWDAGPHGSPSQAGGYTALAVLSLLYAGETYQAPRLRDAVEHLKHLEMRGTYAISLRAMIWAKLPPKFRNNLLADTQWLLDGFSQRVGGWNYEQEPNTNRRDNSITQYGALALWEAAKRGVGIDRAFWRRLEDAFINCQLPDGGWNYTANDDPPRGSMTTAGLATLFITQDFLHAADAVKLSSNSGSRNQRAIEAGLDWMNSNFSASENPGGTGSYYYYMYGVERVGLASGLKCFGSRDWYRQGAAEIIAKLCSWDAKTRTMSVKRRSNRGRITTVRFLSFGLMFLSRGRVPVAINKLKTPDLRWNNRPRDAANLVAWITDATETELSWQIVDIDGEPEQWLDAPVLYLASNQALPWLKEVDINAAALKREVREFIRRRAAGEIAMDSKPPAIPSSPELVKLKRYLDLGGMILAVNEGSSSAFADSVRKIGTLMYPQYDWRALGDDHWAYTIHSKVRGGKPSLVALSNGVRELIVLCPTSDIAATLQGRDTKRITHFQTAANLYFYASELNRPRPRLAEHIYAGDEFVQARRTATVVRALHEGNWKPEPRALEVFRTYLASEHGIELRIIDKPLHEIDRMSPMPDLVIVSGTDEHEFTIAQRQEVRDYATSGGIVLFETPGGSGEFTISAERMAGDLFGGPVRSLRRHPIITGENVQGAMNLSRIDYRPYSFEVFGSRQTTPRLRGMQIDGGVRLIFSREDITHALLDQPCWGVSGYEPDAARILLANIVRYALIAGDGS